MAHLPTARRPWRAGVTALSVACLALTACSPTENAADPSANADSGQAGFPRTIEHAMGETTVETKPVRVAALDSSYVDAALALELEVVAYTKYRAYDELPDYLGDDAKYGKDAKVIGPLESPDVEQLYDIAPDLIVSAKVRHEKLYTELTDVAPTVFSETTGSTWKDNIRLLAKATGREELAEEKIGAYERRAKTIGDAVKAKAGGDATYSLVRFVEGEPTVRLYSHFSFPGIVMTDLGLQRPAGQPDSDEEIAIDVSQENIAQLDADTVYVSAYADPTQTAEDPKARFQSNPLWGTLTGDLKDVDDNTWFTSVSLQGAHAMLDDIADQFGVDHARS